MELPAHPPGGNNRPTIETIAREAGVSISTVSRALRNHPLVSEDTCRRIQDIAKRLSYTPNPYVSALMSHLRMARPIPYQANIAIVDTLSGVDEWKKFSVQKKFHQGVLERSRQLGYTLERFWAGGSGTTKKNLTRILSSRGIRGVLIPPLQDYSTKGEDIPLDHEEFACVTIGCKVVDPGFHFATNDQYVTGQLAHERLLDLGYKRVGMAIPDYVECIVERRFSAGFRNASERRGRSIPKQAVLRYGEANSKKEFLEWVEAYKPDAVCSTFPIVKDWLESAGKKVPQEIAVALLDLDSNLPGWSGVDQESELVGAAAVDLLVQLLQRNELSVPKNPFGLTIEGRWVDGETAPPKNAG
jgi:DNA-binding LacI/PurR family transcriptional regulator